MAYEKIFDEREKSVLESVGEVHSLKNGFRDLYFQPTPPGTQNAQKKVKKREKSDI